MEIIQQFIAGILAFFFGIVLYTLRKISSIEKDYMTRLMDMSSDNTKRYVTREEFSQVIALLHNDLKEIKDLLKEYLTKGGK